MISTFAKMALLMSKSCEKVTWENNINFRQDGFADVKAEKLKVTTEQINKTFAKMAFPFQSWERESDNRANR